MKWNNNNNLVPIIRGIIVFIFMYMDSEPGPNEYGPNPKGVGPYKTR